MAALVEGRLCITDANGNAVSGGKVRIYNANTTTLTTLYSDAALTVPLTNPVVADSSGIVQQIWAAEATTVDVAYLTAAGAVIPGRTYEDMVFLGSTTGALIRDLTNSRFQVRNSGGVVQIETGNATGDDVGGSGRVGGWAGTQGDDLSVDYATVGVTGLLTESNGKKLPGIVYTPRTAFSGASTVTIALPNQPSGVIAWNVKVYEFVITTTDQNLSLTFSADGASFGGGGVLITNLDAAGTDLVGVLNLNVITNTGSKRTLCYGTVHTYIGGTMTSTAVCLESTTSLGRCTHIKLTAAGGQLLQGAYRVIPERGYE